MQRQHLCFLVTLNLIVACGVPSDADPSSPSPPPSPSRDAGNGDGSSPRDAGGVPVADAGLNEDCPGDNVGRWPAEAAELTDGIQSRIDCADDIDLFYYEATEAVSLDVVVTDPRLQVVIAGASNSVGVSRGQLPGQLLIQIPSPERIHLQIAQGSAPPGTPYEIQLSVESASLVCPGDRVLGTVAGATPMATLDPIDTEADNQRIFVSAESDLDCAEDVDTFVFHARHTGSYLLRMQRRDGARLNCRFLSAGGAVLDAQEGEEYCELEQAMEIGDSTFLEASNAAGSELGSYEVVVLQLMDMATCLDNDLQFGERCEHTTRDLPCNRICRPILSRCGEERAAGQTWDHIDVGSESHGFDCSYDTDYFQLVHGAPGTYAVTVQSDEQVHCSSWWSTGNNVNILSRRMTGRQCSLSVRIREGDRGAFRFLVGARNPFSQGDYTVGIERSD